MHRSVSRSPAASTVARFVAAFALGACSDDPVAPDSSSAPRPQLLALARTAAPAMVSAGDYHTCGLKADGTVVCWGRNAAGQLAPPAGLADVTYISAGGQCTLAANQFGDASYIDAPQATQSFFVFQLSLPTK